MWMRLYIVNQLHERQYYSILSKIGPAVCYTPVLSSVHRNVGIWPTGKQPFFSFLFLRVRLSWILCTLYYLAHQVTIIVGDSCLCGCVPYCVCDVSRALLPPFACSFSNDKPTCFATRPTYPMRSAFAQYLSHEPSQNTYLMLMVGLHKIHIWWKWWAFAEYVSDVNSKPSQSTHLMEMVSFRRADYISDVTSIYLVTLQRTTFVSTCLM